MLIKTIKVTNPKNVVLQIPGYVSSTWGLLTGSQLDMHFENGQVIIKPSVYGRNTVSESSNEVVSPTRT